MDQPEGANAIQMDFKLARGAARCSLPSVPSYQLNSVSPFQFLPYRLQFSTVVPSLYSKQPATVKVKATAGKGFGKAFDRKPARRNSKGGAGVCPCGGGELKLQYEKCCKPYHAGEAFEPDATTLMKARFTAYANGLVDYVVRTTHSQNTEFQGAKQLADDVQATCARMMLTKLEILNSENVSENEACVLFRVTYFLRKGSRGDKKFLVENSRFLQEGGRWFYREKIPLTQGSEVAEVASTNSNFIQAELARKAYDSLRPRKA